MHPACHPNLVQSQLHAHVLQRMNGLPRLPPSLSRLPPQCAKVRVSQPRLYGCLLHRRPQVRTAGQRPARGPSLRGFTAERLGTPASAGTAARRAAAAHRCPDSRRRGLERRLPAGTARHRRTESHKAGGAQTREPREPPLPPTAMRRITPLSKLAQWSNRPTLNQGRTTLVSGLIDGTGRKSDYYPVQNTPHVPYLLFYPAFIPIRYSD